MKVAILDDYARAALQAADWSAVRARAEVDVFDHHLSQADAIAGLWPYDVLCTVRERMALPRALFEKLPRLKLVTIIGQSLPNLDMEAATEHGVAIATSNMRNPAFANIANATPELAWGLMIATVRHLAHEHEAMRKGGWQSTTGLVLSGRTLGLVGLGRIGQRMARYAQAFGMEVIAWSQNLTPAQAAAAGAGRVEKDELFARSDVVSIHYVLSDRSRGLVTARELGLMQPTAYLINTSRGPIVEEAALLAALREGRIAGAGLDVFDREPLPKDHPFRALPNVTLSPHLGYVTKETLAAFYGDTVEAVAAFLEGAPIRIANPKALEHAKHRA
jgi:phosphoglycerate dehydrogenase-like enzyme